MNDKCSNVPFSPEGVISPKETTSNHINRKRIDRQRK
jgi:hypothetical protein